MTFIKTSFVVLLSFFLSTLSAQTFYSISQIQGTGSSSPYEGEFVKTSGIVTARFVGTGSINGFFLQDAVGDNNPLSSDGIFIYSSEEVKVGDKIELTGKVTEYFNRTQLSEISNLTTSSENNALPIVKIKYNPDNFDWEQYEGMLLEFDQELFVTSNWDLEQYGQITLQTSRRLSPTNQELPGSAEYNLLRLENEKPGILLDDAINTRYYSHRLLADANGTRRVGEKTRNLRAVVDYNNARYSLYPVNDLVFYGNQRPTVPAFDLPYNLKVCAFNLEYYLTMNYGQGFGASNETMAARQHTKIMTALLAIDADVYGVIEIEQGQEALMKLVNALNTATVANRYDYINDKGTAFGTYVKVGFIYRKDKIEPYKDLKNINNPTPVHRKKAQAFTLKSNNERFILSINHFKAKSGCANATGLEGDQFDGQSCYNPTRVAEANATITMLNSYKSYYEDTDILVMGDLNAYAMEDPITAFTNAGYTDLHRAFHADSSYSYVYRGEMGYLDYALASSTLLPQVRGMQAFNINAAEPGMFGFDGSSYQPDMYRCSDHDPVIVTLMLGDTNGIDSTTFKKADIHLQNGNLSIKNAENGELTIFQLNGALMGSIKIDSDAFDFSMQSLNSGAYVVKVNAKGLSHRKLVLKY